MKSLIPVVARSSLIAAGFFSLFVFSYPVLPAADFDFYASDLLSREAYRKISMDFKDASLKNILKVFSQQAGLNFIASENVQDRTVTLYLDQVPLKEAMDKIMSANNLTYDLDPKSNIFVVKEWGKPKVETTTKAYYLKYTRLKSSKLQQAGSQQSGSSGAGAAGSSGGGEEGIEASVKAVLTSNGSLVSDTRTNSLVVTDIPTQFEAVDKVVSLLDVATPQVMIEVEMLDVSKDTLDELGVNTTSGLLSLTGSEAETRFPNFFADGIPGVASPAFTYGTLSAALFQATLELLITDTRTKFLARPRILSLSNESAEIKITTNEAVGVIKQTSGEGASSNSTESAERVETGVSLKVTPQVDPKTGFVTMFIQPSVSEAKSSTVIVNGTNVKDPETRSSIATLMVKDGETIVVGGLIRNNEEIVAKKMPLLGDIPFVGMLFRHKTTTVEERELIVFITPRIINYDNAAGLVKLEKRAKLRPPSKMPAREQPASSSKTEAMDKLLGKWGK